MKRLFATLSLALLTVLASAGAVQAANPSRILATPSTACRALVQLQAGGYTGFADCMSRINADIAACRFPADPTNPSSPLLSLAGHVSVLLR